MDSLLATGLYAVASWLLAHALRTNTHTRHSNSKLLEQFTVCWWSNRERAIENTTSPNKYFDHTILKADATVQALDAVIDEAKRFRFQSVCVNSCHASYVKEKLRGYDDIRVCCVVGFPLGAMDTTSKVNEARKCIYDGASEIDMVMNVGYFKSGDNYRELFINDLKEVIDVCHQHNIICKVILETCLLSLQEVRGASILALEAGADFIKTSTGFSTNGATVEAVQIMIEEANKFKRAVKASGGIRDGKTAKLFIDMGVGRLGTSSTVQVYEQLLGNSPINDGTSGSSTY